ncbi:MAG TPA: hypothetical protein ENK18_24165 [Deltaproteobacteria bacterium]|nr:hypothetical protein [Deltaproteobacteria bacterium]
METRRRVVITAPTPERLHAVQPAADRGEFADLAFLAQTTPLAVGLSLEAFPPTSELEPPTEALNLW